MRLWADARRLARLRADLGRSASAHSGRCAGGGPVGLATSAIAHGPRCHPPGVYGLDGPPLGGAHLGEVTMKKRSGSEKRRATVQRNLRFTPAQNEALCKLAEAHGHSLAALVVHKCLGDPLPRQRQPRANEQLLRQFYTECARTRDALKPTEAELGKSGSNLNQITHVLNTDRAPESVMNILESTLQAHFEVLQLVAQAVRDLLELRTAGMNSIGLELRHGSDDGDK